MLRRRSRAQAPDSNRMACPTTSTWWRAASTATMRSRLERRQRERHQRRHAIADLQIARVRGQRRADALHAPEQHAARAGDRVVLLAALGDGVEDLRRHVARLLHLAERGRVDVEPLHVEEQLVVVELLHVVVDAPGRLRQASPPARGRGGCRSDRPSASFMGCFMVALLAHARHAPRPISDGGP